MPERLDYMPCLSRAGTLSSLIIVLDLWSSVTGSGSLSWTRRDLGVGCCRRRASRHGLAGRVRKLRSRASCSRRLGLLLLLGVRL